MKLKLTAILALNSLIVLLVGCTQHNELDEFDIEGARASMKIPVPEVKSEGRPLVHLGPGYLTIPPSDLRPVVTLPVEREEHSRDSEPIRYPSHVTELEPIPTPLAELAEKRTEKRTSPGNDGTNH